MSIAQNAACTCGSGKKYKRCCGLDTSKKKQKKQPSFFKEFNTINLLQTFAGLSLLPENHGKNIRFEDLAQSSIRHYNKSKKNPSSKSFKQFLDKRYSFNHLEDPPVNLFTDLITFYGGDYLLFPGITENGIYILQNLVAAIYHWPGSGIPNQFRVNCRHIVSLILAMSNAIATRLGYKRYEDGNADDNKIVVPNDINLNNLQAAVTFSIQEIKQLCDEHQVAFEAIEEFLIDINSPDFNFPYVGESPLLYKPILQADERFIIISPTTLSFALTDYIWTSAEEMGCMKEVNAAYHGYIWNYLQMQLGQMEFKRIDIAGIELEAYEGLYQFDDDKIAYIQYLYDKGESYKLKVESRKDNFGKAEDKENHTKKIISQLLEKHEFSKYEILFFIIHSSIGREFMCPLAKVDHARTIVVPIYEFDVLWSLKNTKALDLWKFSIAKEQLEDANFLNFSFLDQYEMYRNHDESFYLSDTVKYNSIQVQVGYSKSLIKQSKHKSDKHSVWKLNNHKLLNVQVERKDEYAPIYMDIMGLQNSELEFLVEGFYQAIWVLPKQDIRTAKGEIRRMYWEINDAIAYWLWQIQKEIRGYLKTLGNNPLSVTFELASIEKFETIERDFTRDPDLFEKFHTDVTADSLNIVIPAEIISYLYGADNEGERIMVKHLLLGINKLLIANGKPLIPEDNLLQILENKAPLGMKKKFFILDTSNNLLLDPRNLKSHRYVQEYDTNIVLDTIVPALGKLCPAVGEIVTHKERDSLSFKIVQNALFPLLKSKISQYNSTELLKRLISLNESLIRKREELRIHTPTRIACFVSSEQHQSDLQENLGDVNNATIVLRCLIEHIAAEPSQGTKIISIAAMDELMAIMNQIISWGSLSDQIHYNLLDIKMSVLPTGRIGTEKTPINNVFDPYYKSKTKENVIDAVSTFEQVFPKDQKATGAPIPENLDKAFVSDYGISLSRIFKFVEGLVHIGFQQENAYSSFPLLTLRSEVNKYIDDFEETEFQNAIQYLSLTNRGKVDVLPTGYEFIDIMPWRFNRMLSLLRKPLILVDEEGEGEGKMVYWGVRQILTSRMYLADQMFSDRLRVFDGSEVKKALGKFAQQRGNSLVKKILSAVNPEGLIIDQDVYIGPNYSLKNDIDIGDIDVLIIDSKNKVLFSLESKNMSPSRNIKEMIEESEKLFGNSSEMGWIDKHMRRDKWLNANKQQINIKYNIDISDFKITSIFITNEDMLTPYLKNQSLPLPFVTSYEIEKGGYDFLIKFIN